MPRINEKVPVALLPFAVALLGAALYLARALQNVRGRTSFLDEGLYQYKGWLYATHRALPFADYAPWTNHMPLSYLIPGYFQKWFGPDLAVGRYLSLGFALLFLVGLWLTARRWGGDWLAAGAVWAVALNLASIKIYSMGLPQAAVACMLVWTLFLTLDAGCPPWQIALAGVLSGLMVMTRLNMALALPVVLGYIWWQHGLKKAGLYLGAAALTTGGLHLLFWPGILKLWAAWLPRSLTPFLDPWRMFIEGSNLHEQAPSTPFWEYLLYTGESIRLHFLALVSALLAWALWPAKSNWKSDAQRAAAVFLSLLLGVLFLAHVWVSFFGGFCVSCILLYEAYFDYLGLLLFAVVFQAIRVSVLPLWRKATFLALVLFVFVGVNFAAYSDMLRRGWAKYVPVVVPRAVVSVFPFQETTRQGVFPPAKLWSLLNFTVLGILLTVLLAGVWILYRGGFERRWKMYLVGLPLLIGGLLSPTAVLGSGNDFFACSGYNVPAAYREAGATLNALIPSGARVAWVGRIPAIFLYLPEVDVYPPQLNHYHSFWISEDDETLYRFSRWNESLGRRWMEEADYTLIEEAWLEEAWVQDALQSAGLQEIAVSPPPEPCRETSRIHVFAPTP